MEKRYKRKLKELSRRILDDIEAQKSTRNAIDKLTHGDFDTALLELQTELFILSSRSGYIGQYLLVSNDDIEKGIKYYSQYFTYKYWAFLSSLAFHQHKKSEFYVDDANDIFVLYLLSCVSNNSEIRQFAAKTINKLQASGEMDEATFDEPVIRFVYRLGSQAFGEFEEKPLTLSYQSIFNTDNATLINAVEQVLDYHFHSALQIKGFNKEHNDVADKYALSPTFDSDTLSLLPIELWAMVKVFPDRNWREVFSQVEHVLLTEPVVEVLLEHTIVLTDSSLEKKLIPFMIDTKSY